MNYELFDEEDVNIENEGNLFGINWLDEDGEIIEVSYFATEEERNEAIDRAYAEQDEHTLDY